MNLSELSPFPVYIEWEGHPIELRPFDLRAVTWAERFFYAEGQNGFERMHRILGDSSNFELFANTIIDIIYYLSIDIERAGVENIVQFKEEALQNGKHLEIIGDFKTAIEQVIENDFLKPRQKEEVTGGEIYKRMKAKNQPEKKEADWEQIYVDFYKAGGISLNDFYKLTMKQIDALYHEINYKNCEEFRLNASIHGIPPSKIKGGVRRRQQSVEFTPEDIAVFEKDREKLLKEHRIN